MFICSATQPHHRVRLRSEKHALINRYPPDCAPDSSILNLSCRNTTRMRRRDARIHSLVSCRQKFRSLQACLWTYPCSLTDLTKTQPAKRRSMDLYDAKKGVQSYAAGIAFSRIPLHTLAPIEGTHFQKPATSQAAAKKPHEGHFATTAAFTGIHTVGEMPVHICVLAR